MNGIDIFGSEDFGGSQTDVVCGNQLGAVPGSGDESPPGQMIGFSQEPAGSLMDSDDSGVIEEIDGDACDSGVMVEIETHILEIETIEMTPGDDT